jgi:hypothetical protein
MHINHAFLQKSPLHGKLGEIVQIGHQMAKANAANRAIHKGQLIGKLHELGAHINAHHGGGQDSTFRDLLAEATHGKMHMR